MLKKRKMNDQNGIKLAKDRITGHRAPGISKTGNIKDLMSKTQNVVTKKRTRMCSKMKRERKTWMKEMNKLIRRWVLVVVAINHFLTDPVQSVLILPIEVMNKTIFIVGELITIYNSNQKIRRLLCIWERNTNRAHPFGSHGSKHTHIFINTI